MKIHTESVQFKADKKLLDFIDKKVGQLTRYFDRALEANVKLKLENSGQIRDKIAEVRIQVPGQSLFARSTNKTFEQSVREAVEDLKRQLTRYKEKMRAFE
jgi:putative sigma-54 modulation protein